MDRIIQEEYKKFLKSVFFGNLCMERGIFILLLSYKGLTISQIAFWQAILNMGMFIAEIPTGVVADIFGKKKSLIIGKILFVVYYLSILFSNDYKVLMMSAVAFGIGSTFISGTNESLLYDILLSRGAEIKKNTSNYLGKFSAITIIAVGASMMMGGVVQKLSWEILLFSCLIFQLVSIVFVKKINIQETNKIDVKETLSRYVEALRFQFKHRDSMTLILALGINIGAISALYILAQDEFSKFGFSISSISLFFAIESLTSFLLLFNLDKLKSSFKSGKSMVIVSMLSILFLGILYVEKSYVFMLGILMISILNNYFVTIMTDRLSLMIDTDIRTTVFSVFNAISALLMAFIFFIISKIRTQYILFVVIVGVVSYVFMILYIIFNSKKKQELLG